MNKILVCDDDKEIVNAIEIYLEKEGNKILKAYNGKEAIEILKEEDVQLIILDVMMPIMDGIEVTKILREKGITTPIIFLTAKSEDYDKIKGLNIGADDYITKPFNAMELIARANSQIRRYTKFEKRRNIKEENKEEIYRTRNLILNNSTKKVIVENEEIKLTPTEFNILKFLVKNKGKVFSISEIYENVWNEPCYGAENIIAVHIRHIREKIEINPKEPIYLKVIWGIGYKIEDL